jgi:hypothetical protein
MLGPEILKSGRGRGGQKDSSRLRWGIMGRNFQAWILLLVFAFCGPGGLAGVYSRMGREAHCCPACCCGRANCPMREHGMAGRCPMMASMAGHAHQTMGCSCSISPNESSPLPAGLLDLRYDLPRASLVAALPAVARDAREPRTASLEGFFPLPELPPKALLS